MAEETFESFEDAARQHVTSTKTIKTHKAKIDDEDGTKNFINNFILEENNIDLDVPGAWSLKYSEGSYKATLSRVFKEGIDVDLLSDKMPDVVRACQKVIISFPPGDIPEELLKYVQTGVAEINRVFDEKVLRTKIDSGEVKQEDVASCIVPTKQYLTLRVSGG